MEIQKTQNNATDAEALRKFILAMQNELKEALVFLETTEGCGDMSALIARLKGLESDAEKVAEVGEILAKELERKAEIAAAYARLHV